MKAWVCETWVFQCSWETRSYCVLGCLVEPLYNSRKIFSGLGKLLSSQRPEEGPHLGYLGCPSGCLQSPAGRAFSTLDRGRVPVEPRLCAAKRACLRQFPWQGSSSMVRSFLFFSPLRSFQHKPKVSAKVAFV